MTAIYGIIEGGLKKTGKDARVLPRTVTYDVELTPSLPVAPSITSGMNAIAHAAEGLYARDTNPVMALHHKLCHPLGGSFDLPHAKVWNPREIGPAHRNEIRPLLQNAFEGVWPP